MPGIDEDRKKTDDQSRFDNILECSGIHDPLCTISHNRVSLNVSPVLLDNYQKN